MARIAVVGGALVGMACAARLAKAGHDVTLYEAETRLGGRWAGLERWPSAIVLPATWRDLFHKSGRSLAAALAGDGLELVPAPDVVHVLADGRRLVLPTDRGEQTAAITDALGVASAVAWRNLVDRLDDTWQELRPLGLEADEPLTRERWRALAPRTSADQLAARLPEPLRPLVLDAVAPDDPRDTPAWAATPLALERMLGRWHLVRSADDVPVPLTALTGVLAQRVADRGVEILTSTPVLALTAQSVTTAARRPYDVVIDTTSPWSGLSRPPRGLLPAVVGTTTLEPCDGPEPPTVDHGIGRTTYTCSDGDAWVRVVRDDRVKREDPASGARWSGARSFRRRPPIVGPDGVLRASPASRGGAEPWGQLLTAALAAYAAHERAAGVSIRPVDDPRKGR